MDIMTGIVIIVAIIVVAAFLILLVALSDGEAKSDPRPTPPPPMWTTTVKTYGPFCEDVRLEGKDSAKVCVREANHDGDHRYKVINLHTQEPRDDVL